jgi:diphthamide biosynthesis enzyme Dph1/Dph2-like protein
MFDRKRNSEILSMITGKKAKRIFIQVPEGLKPGVRNLVDFLGKKGFEIFISIEPCFGSCFV